MERLIAHAQCTQAAAGELGTVVKFPVTVETELLEAGDSMVMMVLGVGGSGTMF